MKEVCILDEINRLAEFLHCEPWDACELAIKRLSGQRGGISQIPRRIRKKKCKAHVMR